MLNQPLNPQDSFLSRSTSGKIMRTPSRSKRTSTTPLSSSTSTPRRGNQEAKGATSSTAVNIVAILDNPARDVGFAVFNMRTNSIFLTQYNEGSSYINTCNMLKVYEPSEVLFPKSLFDSKLASIVKQELESNADNQNSAAKAKVTFIARKLFNENKGVEIIDTLMMDDNASIKSDTIAKYLSVSSLSAVVQYVEFIQELTFQPRSLRINYVACDGHLMLDSASISSLEIVRSLKYGNSHCTLLSHIDNTKTPMGKRIIRSNILQPLLDVNSLNARLDSTEEILSKEKEFFEIGALLAEFSSIDLSHLLTQFTHTRKNARGSCHTLVLNIISLRKMLSKLPKLESCMREYNTPILQAICSALKFPENESLQEEMDEIINEKSILSCKNKQQQIIFAVAPEIDALLDIGRKKYIETVEEIHEHHKHCQSEAGISSLKLKYNVRRGYHFSIEGNYTFLI